MTKEVLEALCKGVQDDLEDRLDAEKTILIHTINGAVRILNELKRKDLPFSTTNRLWDELSLKIKDLFECKGKINAYGYAKNLSSVLSAKKEMK
jgi:hypothetical protein